MGKAMWVNWLMSKFSPVDRNKIRCFFETLSMREIRIIMKHEDLVDRVKEIFKYTKAEMLDELRKSRGLEIECHEENVWIETEELDKITPEWINYTYGTSSIPGESKHVKLTWPGFYMTFEEEKAGEPSEFTLWARETLLLEVRERLWARYIEYKAGAKKGKVGSTKDLTYL